VKEREVWREERTSFAFVHSTELGLLKADDIELKRLDQVAHNITFVSIAQTTHIPGENGKINSLSIHSKHNTSG
jgi:alkyl hydroperoxide reductase subunit AhpF